MSRWIVLFALMGFIAGCSEPSNTKGFAGLAEQVSQASESEFLQPGPGDQLQFPEDFGPHPQHRIEWWYLTANLTTADGEPLGLQWTQFRQALKPRPVEAETPDPDQWPLEAAWMAHAAVSYQGQHWFEERLARGDIGHAGAEASPINVWLDHWLLTENTDTDKWRLQVEGDDWSYDLTLSNLSQRVAHGEDGFSAKSFDGQGSMYFSLVDLNIEGEVTLHGKAHQVTGQGWFDREWSSQFLKAGQQGWDWFALHLNGGQKLMAFRLRDDEQDFLSGTWVSPDGKVTSLDVSELAITGSDNRGSKQGKVPTRFSIQVPEFGVELTVQAPSGNYWNAGLYPYWESPVSVTGSHQGVGYVELTGYQ